MMSIRKSPHNPLSLRERQKVERRDRILFATMEMLLVNPFADITNSEIAGRAGVTIPTIYNLIGGRADILVHLLNAAMIDLADHISRDKTPDAIARAENANIFLVAKLTKQAKAYRQVVRGVNAVSLLSRQPYLSSPHEIYLQLTREAEENGAFLCNIKADHVATQLFHIFAGALVTWAIEGLTNKQFSWQVTSGFHTVIAAYGVDKYRNTALARLRRNK